MRILIVGENERPHAVARALEARGVEIGRPSEAALPDTGDDEVGEIAAALIAFETLFAEEAPDAVLLVSDSDLALAAVLVATKARIPVARLEERTSGDGRPPGMNRRLIERLADATVTADAGVIAAWLHNLVAV